MLFKNSLCRQKDFKLLIFLYIFFFVTTSSIVCLACWSYLWRIFLSWHYIYTIFPIFYIFNIVYFCSIFVWEMILDKTCIVFWSNPWTNIIYGFCVVCIVVIVLYLYTSHILYVIFYVGSEIYISISISIVWSEWVILCKRGFRIRGL